MNNRQDQQGGLNMDRSQRVVVDTTAMDWEPSPAKGVWRKKLERQGGESGQVTSVVRYEAGSRFRSHAHPLGEELLVLEGVFEDEHGRYPAGSYLRNPPGSRHTPASSAGCVLLVKLDMFDPGDLRQVYIDTGLEHWQPGMTAGLSVMPLHSYQVQHTALVRWDPGTQFSRHWHPGGEEIYVLKGVFEDESGTYPQGTWLRNPPDSEHHPFSREGCTIFVKTGHML